MKMSADLPDCVEVNLARLTQENADLKAKLAQAVIEANRRDQKWMDGINEILGEKLNYTDPGGHNHASMALDKWARDIKAKLAQVEAQAKQWLDDVEAKCRKVDADAASMREALTECRPIATDCHSNDPWCQCKRCKALATGTGQALLDELAVLRATAERRLGLLRKCMWIPAKAGPWCPGCERLQEFGHKPDCQLAAELSGKEGA